MKKQFTFLLLMFLLILPTFVSSLSRVPVRHIRYENVQIPIGSEGTPLAFVISSSNGKLEIGDFTLGFDGNMIRQFGDYVDEVEIVDENGKTVRIQEGDEISNIDGEWLLRLGGSPYVIDRDSITFYFNIITKSNVPDEDFDIEMYIKDIELSTEDYLQTISGLPRHTRVEFELMGTEHIEEISQIEVSWNNPCKTEYTVYNLQRFDKKNQITIAEELMENKFVDYDVDRDKLYSYSVGYSCWEDDEYSEYVFSEWTEYTNVNTFVELFSNIKIIRPNKNETYSNSDSIVVKWIDGTDSGKKDIYIFDTNNSEVMSRKNMFMRSSGIDSYYEYKINENIPNGNYRVKICKSNSNDCNYSDIFSIKNTDINNSNNDLSDNEILNLIEELFGRNSDAYKIISLLLNLGVI
jgi:hypothetical protein